MADAAWKQWEREVAADLGGRRSGPQGSDVPDVYGVDLIAPECKLQANLSLKKQDIDQARDNARKIGKEWILFLKERRKPGEKFARKVVVMDYHAFIDLYNRIP